MWMPFEQIDESAYGELAAREPSFNVVCWNCGKHYSLHMTTVCPRCFSWPKLGKENEMTPEEIEANTAQQCFHVHLKRMLTGSFAWYECESCHTKFMPHKRDESIPIWDGKMKVVR